MSDDAPTEYTRLNPPKWEVGERLLVARGDGNPFLATITEVGDRQPDGSLTVTCQQFPDAGLGYLSL